MKAKNCDMDLESRNKIRFILDRSTVFFNEPAEFLELKKILERYNYEFSCMDKFNVTKTYPFNIQLLICVLFGLEEWVDKLKSKIIEFYIFPPHYTVCFDRGFNVLKKFDYKNSSFKKYIFCKYAYTRDSLDEITEIFNYIDNDYGYVGDNNEHGKYVFKTITGSKKEVRQPRKINTLFEFLILSDKYDLARQVEEDYQMKDNKYFQINYTIYKDEHCTNKKSATKV